MSSARAGVVKHYPRGMHTTIAEGIQELLGDRARTNGDPRSARARPLQRHVGEHRSHLVGHAGHALVDDAVVARVHERVLLGMGLIVPYWPPLQDPPRLMGTTCSLRWREAAERELVWNVAPGHPITRGLPEVFAIPEQEMYGEFFDIPPPDELVFISSYTGGEVFRSGCAFRRGQGRIFYFSPTRGASAYHQAEVPRHRQRGRWTAQPGLAPYRTFGTTAHSPTGWFDVPPTER